MAGNESKQTTNKEKVAGKQHFQMFTIGIITIAVTIVIAIVTNAITIHLSSYREVSTPSFSSFRYLPSTTPSEPILMTGTVRMSGMFTIEILDNYLNGTVSIMDAIINIEAFFDAVISLSRGEDGDYYMQAIIGLILEIMRNSTIIGEPTIEQVELIREGRNLLAELLNTSIRADDL